MDFFKFYLSQILRLDQHIANQAVVTVTCLGSSHMRRW